MTGFQGLVWYSKLDRTLTYIKVSVCSRVVLVLASSFRKDGVREFGHTSVVFIQEALDAVPATEQHCMARTSCAIACSRTEVSG